MANEKFDVVVIGAGPAGSRAASVISKAGFSVLLLEKREKVGFPVRCAEAVGPREDVERYLKLEDRLISSEVNGVVVVAPDGTRFEARMPQIGFIVDRELFDQELARIAVENGAELRTSHQAISLTKKDGKVSGVNVLDLVNGERYSVEASIVIGADGVESLSPRWAGLKKQFSLGEIFSCAQELIDGIDLTDSFIEFHLGSQIAPGGYAWVFPKGGNSANVGVGVNPVKVQGKVAVDYLATFISRRCPEGKRERKVIGGCEVAKGLRSLATDGYVVIGEAGNQNNPFSGGGIINALEGADMAAEVIISALKKQDTSEKMLSRYTRMWNRSVGRNNNLFYHAARVFYELTDDEMNKIIKRLISSRGTYNNKGVNPIKMLIAIALSSPGFFIKVIRSLMSQG